MHLSDLNLRMHLSDLTLKMHLKYQESNMYLKIKINHAIKSQLITCNKIKISHMQQSKNKIKLYVRNKNYQIKVHLT